MGQFLQVLGFVTIAVFLLWFGYTLFIRIGLPASYGYGPKKRKGPKPSGIGLPGDPHTCPVCSAKLEDGLLVKSIAFPSLNGGEDRFMHIKGCVYCLSGERDRICPVCGHVLIGDEILICRLFERNPASKRRAHVHVLGCSHCRRV
ncbi:MAG: hypothetical protein LBI14_00210 [Treponema sp.]|nr:hypothetical protein [Treponema sp.]